MDRARQALRILTGRPVQTANNSVPVSRDFLINGGRGSGGMGALLDGVGLDDKAAYTGFVYRAIRTRANRVAQLAETSLRTRANDATAKAARRNGVALEHPYLGVLDTSSDFANGFFYQAASTLIDLEGVHFVFVLRTVKGDRIGNPQAFKVLNPWRISRVRDRDGNLVGYRETRPDGATRDFAVEQIIEVRDFNPFSTETPLSMLDAVREDQYTLRTARDYTRRQLKGNLKRNGLFSTDLELTPDELREWKAATLDAAADGEPIFTDTKGNVKYTPTAMDLDKAALDKINAMSLEALIAVTGMSKTLFGIEVSGVTRDTSKVQSDLFITNHVMPQLQLIADALNQDYKVRYPKKYEKTGYRLFIDSPLGTDREAEAKDVEIRQSSFELYTALVDAGYEREVAGRYATGDATLAELGEPKKPEAPPAPATPPADTSAEQSHDRCHDHATERPAVRNAMSQADAAALAGNESSLKGAVQDIEARLVAAAALHVTTNAYDTPNDVTSETDRHDAERELELVLAAFMTAVVPLYAATTMSRRLAEFELPGTFTLTLKIRETIGRLSGKAATSHIATVVDDLLAAARQAAIEGASRDDIAAAIRSKYTAISQNRAATIAASETNCLAPTLSETRN